MIRALALVLLALCGLAVPAAAQPVVYETVEETVVWVDEQGNEVAPPAAAAEEGSTWRFVAAQPSDVEPAPMPQGIARFGPFRVLDHGTAAMVDISDSRTPAQFAAMLRAFPAIRRLELVEVPGTEDDRANLALGRLIRAHGIATHVPAGGSVRSGGVELFVAGIAHTADPGAKFAVHAWEDEDGRGPRDYAMTAPENRAYLEYYRDMGLSPTEAAAFYAMTNAAPFEAARFLNTAQMGQWLRLR
ncbi:MAG: hypothetical protein RIQ46_2063 [Pseudomonadota bacterium]|jgi:hypothetical protein